MRRVQIPTHSRGCYFRRSEGVAKTGLHRSLPVLLRDLSERGVSVVRIRSIPVRMVREIKCIKPEGQRLTFEGVEAFQNRSIEILLPGSTQQVTHMLRSERTGSWRREDRRSIRVGCIEPGIVVRADGELTLALQVCSGSVLKKLIAAARANTGHIGSGRNRERGAGLELVSLRKLPAPERLVEHPIAALERNVI